VMRSARIIQGHVLDALRSLPEASVQCVVTSPPYWGLRDYKLEPQIWGGEAGCAHAWGDEGRKGGGSHRGRDLVDGPNVQLQRQAVPQASTGAFCGCGAWRGSLGLEPTISLYLAHLVVIFEEVRRVLRDDGTLWLNIGDSYWSRPNGTIGLNGDNDEHAPATRWRRAQALRKNRPTDGILKHKDLCLIPARLAIALQEAGWYARSDIVWSKPAPMPESVTDRPTRAHEYLFLLTKSPKYFYDGDAVREPLSEAVLARPYKQVFNAERSEVGFPGGCPDRRGAARKADALKGSHGTNGHDGNGMRMPEKWSNPAGRNLRSVWTIAGAPFSGAHFATFPPGLAERCIKAGTSERGCCPECGAPWKRETAVRYGNPGNRSTNGPRSMERRHLERGTAGYAVRLERHAETVGWRYTCDCLRKRIEAAGIVWPITPEQAEALAPQFDDLAPIPCTVLDPFGGAGTTAMVALRLNRQAISIELSPEYTAMQRRRIQDDAPLLNSVTLAEARP
jgi:DNA modification methylase